MFYRQNNGNPGLRERFYNYIKETRAYKYAEPRIRNSKTLQAAYKWLQSTRAYQYFTTKLPKWAQAICLVFAAGFLYTFLLYIYFILSLPSVSELSNYSPSLVTKVYSADKELVAEFFEERRVMVSISQVPQHVINTVLAAEDRDFYKHGGIKYISILRALYVNLTTNRTEGASTITQQVAKNILLTPERTYTRKFKEMILAKRIERAFTKDQILELYLNQIYFGNGAYGIQAACEAYFGKHVKDIDVAEAAMLMGLISNPTKYSPYQNPSIAKARQERVIRLMLENGFITEAEEKKAATKVLDIKPSRPKTVWIGPYFTEHVRRYLEEKYGERLYKEGLRVYTTLNVKFQVAANEAVEAGLRAYDKRNGYRGPIGNLKAASDMENFKIETQKQLGKNPVAINKIYRGIITEIDKTKKTLKAYIGTTQGTITQENYAWVKHYNPKDIPDGAYDMKSPLDVLHAGDIVDLKVLKINYEGDNTVLSLAIEQEPQAEAALIAMEPSTGYVRAMVGGSDFYSTQFIRPTQSKRQPGSAFKPLIYAAAIDSGKYTPATTVLDSPMVFAEIKDVVKEHETDSKNDSFEWKPRNYDGKFLGPTTIRKAVALSRNVITIKVLQDIGVDPAIEYARKFGIESPLAKDLSIALGSSAVTLEELTRAFSTIANRGVKTRPIYVTKVTDKNGVVLEEFKPETEEVLSPQSAYITTSLLQGVVEHGTGWRAKALGRPSAGKTGTTNNLNDAWYIGYTTDMITGVWVGYDKERMLGHGETGSTAASPIWVDFMKVAIEGTAPKSFPIPEDIEFVKIDSETGLLATPTTVKPIFEVFRKGTAPKEFSIKKQSTGSSDFFREDLGGDSPPPTQGGSIPDATKKPVPDAL
ncbi:MAG: PBP1A family penicillin-binding protein [Deltaproteobacteria bacterium]|nr:PBP1A family penicillin-binding protein [Deltaproteobacteria bacterium]